MRNQDVTPFGLDEVDFDAICGPVTPHDHRHGTDPVRATFRDPGLEASFDYHGVSVVPFLTAEAVVRVLNELDALGPAPGDTQEGWYAGNHSTSVAWKSELRRRVEPIVAERVAELFDDHVIFNITTMTKWPTPSTGTVVPHLDVTMVEDEGRHRGITLWCPLNSGTADRPIDRGTLRVVPGSHRWPIARWDRARGTGRPSGFDAAEADVLESLAEPVPAATGEAIVRDHRTVHCSHPNTTDEPRRVLAVGLRPREAANVHIEVQQDGSVAWYRVDDRYFLEAWTEETSYPLVRTRPRAVPPTLSRADVAALVEAHGPPPWAGRPAPVPTV